MKKILTALICMFATHVVAQESAIPAAPAAGASAASSADSKSKAKPAAKRPVRADRLELETTVVTGNRELPKVLYIVPWKRAELGELPAQPFNTLLDEVLQPVDRDVFRREVKYFHAIQSGADATPAIPTLPPAR